MSEPLTFPRHLMTFVDTCKLLDLRVYQKWKENSDGQMSTGSGHLLWLRHWGEVHCGTVSRWSLLLCHGSESGCCFVGSGFLDTINRTLAAVTCTLFCRSASLSSIIVIEDFGSTVYMACDVIRSGVYMRQFGTAVWHVQKLWIHHAFFFLSGYLSAPTHSTISLWHVFDQLLRMDIYRLFSAVVVVIVLLLTAAYIDTLRWQRKLCVTYVCGET